MTDAEIKKALECCIKSHHFADCFKNKCPCVSEDGCTVGKETLYPYALDLINRQQEMIDALIAGQETLQKALAEKNAEIERLLQKLQQPQAEAIKEFWNRLQGIAYRSEVVWSHGEHPMLIELDDAEEIYEEMVGDAE